MLIVQFYLKEIFKDNVDIISGNCYSHGILFHCRKENTTLKELSKIFWKETIDLYNKNRELYNDKEGNLCMNF